MTRPSLTETLRMHEGAGPMRVGDKICQRGEYRERRGEGHCQIAGQAEKLR